MTVQKDDPFTPAQKVAAKAKIGIYGVAGSGKTMTSLQLMRGLVGPEGKIALVDAEGGSSQTYADKFSFGLLVIRKPFSAAKFVAAIDRAIEHGYDGLIIDGVSPWWEGDGGILQVVDQSKRGDASGGWLTGRPLQNAIESAIDNCPIHLVATIRAKNETVIETVNGKQRPVQVGMKPTMSDSMRYVFGFLFYVNHTDHALITSKHRWDVVDGMELLPDVGAEPSPAEQLGRDMREWLEAGVQAPPPTTPPVQEENPPTPAPEAARGAQNDADEIGEPPTKANPVTEDQTLKIGEQLTALIALKPDADWETAIRSKFDTWFPGAGVVMFADLSEEQAAVVLEKMELSRLRQVEKAAAPAA